jgi:hypothetical protein
MSETIRVGGLEVRFLQSKEDTGGSLDAFEMTVQPNARMPVPHYHESWDEVAYGLTGAATFRVANQDIVLRPNPFSSSVGSCMASETTRGGRDLSVHPDARRARPRLCPRNGGVDVRRRS